MPRNKPRKTTFSVNFDAELLARVDALAEREARSRANQIRWLVMRALERAEKPAPETTTAVSASAA